MKPYKFAWHSVGVKSKFNFYPMSATATNIVTSAQVTLAYLQAIENLTNVENLFLEVSFDYDTLESLIEMQIWGDKEYLRNCEFSDQLPPESILTLSNDTTRKAALRVARSADSNLAAAHKAMRDSKTRYNVAKAKVQQLEALVSLMSANSLTELSKDLLPLSVAAWFA